MTSEERYEIAKESVLGIIKAMLLRSEPKDKWTDCNQFKCVYYVGCGGGCSGKCRNRK